MTLSFESEITIEAGMFLFIGMHSSECLFWWISKTAASTKWLNVNGKLLISSWASIDIVEMQKLFAPQMTA